MMMMVMFLVIGVLVTVVVLKNRDPIQNAEVKALEYSSEISSYLNMYQREYGTAEIKFNGAFDVKVVSADKRYFVTVNKGEHKGVSRVILYPERAGYTKELLGIEKVCVGRGAGQEIAEVTDCGGGNE